jgi:hypothetical protein
MSIGTDKCKCCGRLTHEGLKKHADLLKEKPIHGTNLNRPLSEIIRDIRRELINSRGGIVDFQLAFPHWEERTKHVEGLLTCGVIALHETLLALEQLEREESMSKLDTQQK